MSTYYVSVICVERSNIVYCVCYLIICVGIGEIQHSICKQYIEN